MPVSAAAKAMPMSRNTRRVIFHSPSPAHWARVPTGMGSALSCFIMSNTASPGARPAISPVTKYHPLQVFVVDGLLLGDAALG
jgi:hypothetical protein